MRCLRETLARLMLGQPRSLELVGIATAALVEGIDSPSLRVLAGLDVGPTLGGESETYFLKSCAELGIAIPGKKEAALYLLDLWLGDISEGRISPYEGCCKIMVGIYYGVYDLFPDKALSGDALGISELVGAYWGYDDLEDRAMEYDGNPVSMEEGRKILDAIVMSCAKNRANQTTQIALGRHAPSTSYINESKK